MRRQAIAALAAGLFGLAAGGCTTSSNPGSTLAALAPESAPAGANPVVSSSTPLPSPAPGRSVTQSATPASADAARLASVPSGTQVAFATVMGAPSAAIEPLSRELSARARQRGITVTAASDPGSGYLLKGYFSAMDDGGSGSVVYVWDVVDASGARLYRIQGQEKLAKGGGWKSVSDGTMKAIADKTIDQLAAWLSQPTG